MASMKRQDKARSMGAQADDTMERGLTMTTEVPIVDASASKAWGYGPLLTTAAMLGIAIPAHFGIWWNLLYVVLFIGSIWSAFRLAPLHVVATAEELIVQAPRKLRDPHAGPVRIRLNELEVYRYVGSVAITYSF